MKCSIIMALGIYLLSSSVQAQNTVKGSATPKPSFSKKDLTKIKSANIKKAASTQFRYFLIKSTTNGYGYDIYADGNLYIHQPGIPAINGEKGFPDTLTAANTARLVIKKIRLGEMPPTITVAELQKLKAIY